MPYYSAPLLPFICRAMSGQWNNGPSARRETDLHLGNGQYVAVWPSICGEVDPHWGDLLLLFCYIITGVLDSPAVLIWGSFVSMQNRQHCILWARPGGSRRGSLLQVGGIDRRLLCWIVVLCGFSSSLLAAAALGALHVVSCPDDLCDRGCDHRHSLSA